MIYKEISKKSRHIRLTDGTRIYWKHVRSLCSFLAKQEESNLIQEVKLHNTQIGQ